MFGGQLTVEEIWLKIWYFILRNRYSYQNIREGNLKTYIQNILKNRVWEQKRNRDILWLNEIEYISIYTSLDQQKPEIENNHPYNSDNKLVFEKLEGRHNEELENMITKKEKYLIILTILTQNTKQMIF